MQTKDCHVQPAHRQPAGMNFSGGIMHTPCRIDGDDISEDAIPAEKTEQNQNHLADSQGILRKSIPGRVHKIDAETRGKNQRKQEQNTFKLHASRTPPPLTLTENGKRRGEKSREKEMLHLSLATQRRVKKQTLSLTKINF